MTDLDDDIRRLWDIVAFINKFSTILCNCIIKSYERCDKICSVDPESPQVRHIVEQANKCEVVETIHHFNTVERARPSVQDVYRESVVLERLVHCVLAIAIDVDRLSNIERCERLIL